MKLFRKSEEACQPDVETHFCVSLLNEFFDRRGRQDAKMRLHIGLANS